jgi:hypothetical protein
MGFAREQGGRLYLQSFEKVVVVGMRSDPEPVDLVINSHSKRPVGNPHASGVHFLPLADAFELKTRMIGIRSPESVRSRRLLLDLRRKAPEVHAK